MGSEASRVPEEKGTAGVECRAWLPFTPNSEIWADSGGGRNLCPSRGLTQRAADCPGLSGQQQDVRKWAGGLVRRGHVPAQSACPPVPPPPPLIRARSARLTKASASPARPSLRVPGEMPHHGTV